MKEKLHPVLKGMIPIVGGIAKTFGKSCEVVLHDITDPYHSIVAIENSHVTERNLGGPMSQANIEAIAAGGFAGDQLNYTKKTPDGRILKSSTIVIRDENQKPIGCLCINFDLSEFVMVRNSINALCYTEEQDENKIEKGYRGANINEVLCNLVTSVLDNSGRPVAYMTKDDKVEIVSILDQKGAFLIKGAIDYVAKVLCVSRYTVYNYLDEVRVGE
ncbi:MAG: PAS domain-containing protein [Bacillota bacterium]|nr:PAS domain-containing protein [Bacillota bacterium]MDD3297857.1 PAS domain-containing protein [Bacillota bacterium]MDD3851063.1 PAS domain-containing protein [Bacillota bacterium]MDD4706980.1 PAS domain-containing protein [Bacillota bacterium]